MDDLVESSEGFAQSGVEVVFDGVVSAEWMRVVPTGAESLADDCPFVAQLIMQKIQFLLFLEGPLVLGEGRIEVVVIAAFLSVYR